MDHAHSESHPHVNYFGIFMALCVCTALSVVFDVVHLTPWLLVIFVLAVAAAKALFVLTYFMHLKFEGRWKFIILAPTAILAVGLMTALAPDMALHYYTNEAPQAKAYRAAHGDSHEAAGDAPAPAKQH
ncbi:cytochrome C oxidase subunit IV family protein [Planctomicrobium sp. SH664]|uniref:cytochrome C oxidase subunit IV family protein n=1 Tax=Planctomicrobium sp. SH664 TaxID=3448125 RepID=UPI003F5B265D